MNNDYRQPACLVSFYVTRNTFTINIGLNLKSYQELGCSAKGNFVYVHYNILCCCDLECYYGGGTICVQGGPNIADTDGPGGPLIPNIDGPGGPSVA